MQELTTELREYFQTLTSEKIEDWSPLESSLIKKTIKKGEHFFRHFDTCQELALVSKGLFRIYLIDNEGEEKTFSFIWEKGLILDFFLTWDNNSPMVSVQAIEDSEIYVVNINSFKQLIDTNTTWSKIYQEALLRNYMRKTKREIEFVLYNAKDRLNKCLKSTHIDVNRIPKTYLASYLGIAAPSLSRLLRDIKDTKEAEYINE